MSDLILPSVERALRPGLKMKTHAGDVVVSHEEAGRITLASGRLVIGDLDFPQDASLVKGALPKGIHAVHLAIARYADGDERITAAFLRLSKRPVAAWRQAGTFGVDSGWAFLADAEARDAYLALPAKRRQRLRDDLARDLEAAYVDTRSAATMTVDGRRGLGLLAVYSGWGEGGYACYVGRDAAGETAVALVDFGLLLTAEDLEELDEEF